MKKNLLFVLTSAVLLWTAYSGFSPADESPKWNKDPRTLISLNPEGVYSALPAGDNKDFSTDVRYGNTYEGEFLQSDRTSEFTPQLQEQRVKHRSSGILQIQT